MPITGSNCHEYMKKRRYRVNFRWTYYCALRRNSRLAKLRIAITAKRIVRFSLIQQIIQKYGPVAIHFTRYFAQIRNFLSFCGVSNRHFGSWHRPTRAVEQKESGLCARYLSPSGLMRCLHKTRRRAPFLYLTRTITTGILRIEAVRKRLGFSVYALPYPLYAIESGRRRIQRWQRRSQIHELCG